MENSGKGKADVYSGTIAVQAAESVGITAPSGGITSFTGNTIGDSGSSGNSGSSGSSGNSGSSGTLR